MCILEEVFKAPSWRGDHVAVEMWPSLESELWTLVTLSPLVHSNLRAQFCSELSATDASDAWEAEVSCETTRTFAQEHGIRYKNLYGLDYSSPSRLFGGSVVAYPRKKSYLEVKCSGEIPFGGVSCAV